LRSGSKWGETQRPIQIGAGGVGVRQRFGELALCIEECAARVDNFEGRGAAELVAG